MEGVLVSAKRDGSPITVTVVSDATGRYGFPADRLAARPLCACTSAPSAMSSAAPAGADVGPERPATADLALPRSPTFPASSPTPNGS